MYLLVLLLGMFTSYFLIALILSKLLLIKLKFDPKRIVISISIILIFTIISYLVAMNISDREFANRLQHALAGGFNIVLVVFLVKRDFEIRLTWFQFVIISILLVGFLGICNEILEYFMQVYFHIIFAPNAIDTWLDLISNFAGAVLGILTFGFFAKD